MRLDIEKFLIDFIVKTDNQMSKAWNHQKGNVGEKVWKVSEN